MTDMLDRVRETPRGRLIHQALERIPHTTNYFASEGRCSYAEAIVELQRLRTAGIAHLGSHMGLSTWRST